MWKIKAIKDKGPTHYYRFHVSGENLSREIPTEFYWNVPDLDDDRYFLADEADATTRETFALARNPVNSKRG